VVQRTSMSCLLRILSGKKAVPNSDYISATDDASCNADIVWSARYGTGIRQIITSDTNGYTFYL